MHDNPGSPMMVVDDQFGSIFGVYLCYPCYPQPCWHCHFGMLWIPTVVSSCQLPSASASDPRGWPDGGVGSKALPRTFGGGFGGCRGLKMQLKIYTFKMVKNARKTSNQLLVLPFLVQFWVRGMVCEGSRRTLELLTFLIILDINLESSGTSLSQAMFAYACYVYTVYTVAEMGASELESPASGLSERAERCREWEWVTSGKRSSCKGSGTGRLGHRISQEAELQALVQPSDCLGEKQVLRNLKSAVGLTRLHLVRRCQQSDLSLLIVAWECVITSPWRHFTSIWGTHVQHASLVVLGPKSIPHRLTVPSKDLQSKTYANWSHQDGTSDACFGTSILSMRPVTYKKHQKRSKNSGVSYVTICAQCVGPEIWPC